MSTAPVLTPVQEQVLALIAAGSTSVAAAAEAGVHRNTVGNWLRTSPAFCHAFARVRFDRALFWRERAESLAAQAIETIRALLADDRAPAGVRLKAALAILDRATAPLPEPPVQLPEPESVHNNAQIPPKETPEKPRPAAPAPPSLAPAANRPQPNPGRNQPCPCGSGRKFKRCCLGKPAARAA